MRPILPLLLSSLARRETPQELSHDRYILQVKQMLDLNNTIGVSDPTYGLLVNSMAIAGMGSVEDPDCLQLAVADVAFTNAKEANNLEGMSASLIYRALERNTASVGIASEMCSSYTPRNPEFTTYQQHQDPASPNAQANNKAVVLELARQLALIGGDPAEALNSGTFEPGELGSISGNSCNTSDCIFEDNRLVHDASESEVYEYIGKCVQTVTLTIRDVPIPTPSVSNGVTITISPSLPTITATPTTTTTRKASSTRLPDTSQTTIHPVTSTSTSTSTTPISTTSTSTSTSSSATSSGGSTQGNQGGNLQFFQGAYLGIAAPAVTQNSDGSFHVESNSNFQTLLPALGRSCDVQKNDCADEANRQNISILGCDEQLARCKEETNSLNS